MPLNGPPALYLPIILLGHAPPHIIATIPLEPAPRVRRMHPIFFDPLPQGLASIHSKKVDLGIMFFMIQFGFREPIRGEFLPAIRHILPSENAQGQHLFGRELRREALIKVLPHGLREVVFVVILHKVMHNYLSWSHTMMG